ncbi:lysylphosphatidylglycerol synthase transmembrane domain-containing protein [Urechidicola sp. KH5]
MLEPLGYVPKFPNLIMSVLLTYIVNLGIPRAGEVARATALTKYEKVPFEKAFGTIVAERIADAIMLAIILSIAFLFQGPLITSYLFNKDEASDHGIYILVGLAVFGLISLLFVIKSQHPIAKKIKDFIIGLIDGAKSIFTMKRKWAFIFHTLFIWAMYMLMFYAVTFALPETTYLPFGAIIVGFVVGGISMAITNGGLGAYPVAVAGALVLYNIDENAANAFGWIMWTAQTLMVLTFGGLSFLFLPLYNKEK